MRGVSANGETLMVGIKDINPVAPVWPSRPPEDVRHKREQSGKERRKERQRNKDDDDDSGTHHLDEFA